MQAHPEALISGTIVTPIGPLVVIEDRAGALFMVEFADCEHRMERWLQKRLASRRFAVETGRLAKHTHDVFAAYFDGKVAALDGFAIRLDGTAFQNEMWTALRDIKPGETLGYGAFAERLDRPNAARAIGHANGSNPLSIVVPCHRLVGADGTLVKYGGGIERKRWLIAHEEQHAGNQPTPI